MKDVDDYVKPPPYIDTPLPDNDPLIYKLKLRIQQDLNQINGVYDYQISETSQKKSLKIKDIEQQYDKRISIINKQRENDIKEYNTQAEIHINNLIISINNPTKINDVKYKKSLYEYLYDFFLKT
jgi:predicted PilT family ATPase